MDDITIKCFLLSAEKGTFSAAAQELFLTRQAVSRQIKKLEEEVGIQLFLRAPGNLKLTPQGENLRVYLQEASRSWERFSDKLRHTKNRDIPRIKLGCAYSLDIWRFLFESVQKAQEKAKFEIDINYHSPDTLMEKLKKGEQDLYVTFAPGAPEDLPEGFVYKPLSHAKMCLVVSKFHPLIGIGSDPARFMDTPMVTWLRRNDTDESCTEACLRTCVGLGLTPSTIRVYPNMESAHAAIEFGNGIGLCSSVSKLTNSSAVEVFPLKSSADLVCMWKPETLTSETAILIQTLFPE